MRRRGLFRNNSVNTTPNTFIGGVSSVITSKTILANLLIIDENDIGYFGIVGSDIEATINVDYTLPSTVFNAYIHSPSRWLSIGGGNTVTYFRDVGKRVKNAGHRIFYRQSNFIEFELEALTNIDYDIFSRTGITTANLPSVTNGGVNDDISNAFSFTSPSIISMPNLLHCKGGSSAFGYAPEVYIPKCTQLGTTTGDDTLFAQSPSGVKITANSALQTANAGAEEGDIAYARSSKSAVITYV